MVRDTFLFLYDLFEDNMKRIEKQRLGNIYRLPSAVNVMLKLSGRVPFDQKFRKSRFKIEWNGHFPEIRFENFGSPLEVVLFSGNLEISEISCSIWHFYPV